MKGQQAMLYTGDTLRQALGKALGTRDQYGRKIEEFGTEKQDGGENPYASPEAIARARENAIWDAKRWISAADVSEGSPEVAIVYLYDKTTGQRRHLVGRKNSDGSAGGGQVTFSSTNNRFRFSFSMNTSREIILVTAHSHSRAISSGGFLARRNAEALNARNEGIDPQNQLDNHLVTLAPLVLKTPSGVVRTFPQR